jgi:hypothetical protein
MVYDVIVEQRYRHNKSYLDHITVRMFDCKPVHCHVRTVYSQTNITTTFAMERIEKRKRLGFRWSNKNQIVLAIIYHTIRLDR